MINSKYFEKYFSCSSPSDMCKALNETTRSKENQAQVNTIENGSANMMEAFQSSPTSDAKKIETEITCQIL